MFLNKNLNANKIKSELNEYGYIIISNIFDENIINKFKEISENKIKELNKKFSLNEKYLKKTIFEQVVNSNEVRNFFDSIDSTNQRYKTEYNCHYLLNHTPKNLNKNSKLSFHFDAYKLTMIIPINTSNKKTDANAMSLDIIPNIRKQTNSMIINLFYKCLIQNKLFRKISNTKIFRYFINRKTVSVKYNQIIIFNGFRSLHSASISKSAFQSEKTRLIIHAYNPFEKNKISKLIFNNIQKSRDKKIK